MRTAAGVAVSHPPDSKPPRVPLPVARRQAGLVTQSELGGGLGVTCCARLNRPTGRRPPQAQPSPLRSISSVVGWPAHCGAERKGGAASLPPALGRERPRCCCRSRCCCQGRAAGRAGCTRLQQATSASCGGPAATPAAAGVGAAVAGLVRSLEATSNDMRRRRFRECSAQYGEAVACDPPVNPLASLALRHGIHTSSMPPASTTATPTYTRSHHHPAPPNARRLPPAGPSKAA